MRPTTVLRPHPQLQRPSLIEYFVSSCCDEEEAESPDGEGDLTPIAPQSQAMMTDGCGKRASGLAYCLRDKGPFVTDPELREVRILDFSDFDTASLHRWRRSAHRLFPNGNLNWVPTDVDVWNPVPGDLQKQTRPSCCSTMVAVTWMGSCPATGLRTGRHLQFKWRLD